MKILNEERKHFSATQLTTYLSCPLKYYFQYELQLPWRSVPSAVAFGDSVHKSVSFMNNSLMNGNPVSQDDLIGTFNKEWATNIETNHIEWRNPDESGDLLVKGTALLEIYYQKFRTFRPRGVEMEFRLPLLDPASGLFIESRDLVGKMDSVSEAGTILEIKTSSKKPSQLDTDVNLQLTMYSFAYRMLYGTPERQILVAVMVKAKEPHLQIIKTQRCEKDYTMLLHLIARVIACIDKGLFYPNQLNPWSCRYCEYIAECEKEWPL